MDPLSPAPSTTLNFLPSVGSCFMMSGLSSSCKNKATGESRKSSNRTLNHLGAWRVEDVRTKRPVRAANHLIGHSTI